MDINRIKLDIHGVVQGVFFRASMKEKADLLHLTGWVANTPDGHVTAEAQGHPSMLTQLIEWAKIGPPSAKVTLFYSESIPIQDNDPPFEVRSHSRA